MYRRSIGAILGLIPLLFAWSVAGASPCQRLQAHPDRWVAQSVDTLVTSARRAYERDEALPAYERTLDRISGQIRRCDLKHDAVFIGRYRTFVEYVETASLDRLPDHELGFLVPDKQYFGETRQLVEIPDFLLQQSFLKLVSR